MTEQEWATSEDPRSMLEQLQWGIGGLWRSLASERKLRLFATAIWWQLHHRHTTGGQFYNSRQWLEAWIDRGCSRIEVQALPYHRGDQEEGFVRHAFLLDPDPRKAVTVYLSEDHAPLQASLLRDIAGNPFRPVRCRKCPKCHGTNKVYLGGTRPLVIFGDSTYKAAATQPAMFHHTSATSTTQTTTNVLVTSCDYCRQTGKVPGLASEWLTSDVIGLARAAYDTRDFSGLPALADALEEAGCTEEAILRHLRGEERISEDLDHFEHLVWRPLRGPHVRGCHVVDLILRKD